jgi:hypothetical protein
MALRGWLKKNITLLTVGFVATIVAVVLTLYFGLHERKPTLIFEVTNDVNVYDVRKPIRDLRILFQGEEIESQNLGLRILILRVRNVGEADVLQIHYDTSEAWGFKVVGGQLIEVRVTDSNSDYLRRRINPIIAGENSVVFDKVIFERGRFVTFEVLILHPRDVRSRIQPFGKIAGIDAIQSVVTPLGTGPTLFQRSVSGPLVVQAIRMVVYFLGFIVTLAALIAIGVGLNGLMARPGKRRRRQTIRAILSEMVDQQARTALERAFAESGRVGLETINRLLANSDRLKRLARADHEFQKRHPDVTDRSSFDYRDIEGQADRLFDIHGVFDELVRLDLVKFEESSGEVKVNPALVEGLTLALRETAPKDDSA